MSERSDLGFRKKLFTGCLLHDIPNIQKFWFGRNFLHLREILDFQLELEFEISMATQFQLNCQTGNPKFLEDEENFDQTKTFGCQECHEEDSL